MAEDIILLAEIKGNVIEDITYQMLIKAREIADKVKSKVIAVLVGYNLEAVAKQLLESGVDKILLADHPLLKYHNPELCANILQDVFEDYQPKLFLFGHTYMGMEVAPILAERLQVPLATNCIDIITSDKEFKVVRPACYGKLRMEGIIRHSQSAIATLQHGALPTRKLPQLSAEIEKIKVKDELVSRLRTKVVDLITPLTEDIDISKADVIIAVGRGIGKRENIALVDELAKAMGGVLACSRPVADMGWLPDSRVVGTSGRKVNPKIYIALGISGALQHIVGMENSKIVVAINKDAAAPIFNYAHYGIVEDVFKVLPIFIEEVTKLKQCINKKIN